MLKPNEIKESIERETWDRRKRLEPMLKPSEIKESIERETCDRR